MSVVAKTNDVNWKIARCKGVDPDVFFSAEMDEEEAMTSVAVQYGIEKAKRICAVCPIRIECLEWALPQSDLVGVWGGLTAKERRSANRPRKKARCIDCRSEELEISGGHEICLSCGLSWPV